MTLPPRSVHLAAGLPRGVIYGGYHLHASRSDGQGTVDEIAAAAERAGLQFIILTDHGDATRPPLTPAYRHGVLCIDAVEISTAAGHLVALNLESPAPYPLAGDPGDVIEDVHRLGGWAIVAHPDSPKPELQWHAWNVPYDGVEWLNADSEWRHETTMRLVWTAARYLVRPAESLALLFRKPTVTLRRWDAVTRARAVVAIGALDAHARIGWNQGEEPRRRTALARPTYEDMFRTITQAVVLDRPLSGDAAADATGVLRSLTAGHTFTVLRAFAEPASLEFTATTDAGTVGMGDRIDRDESFVAFRARIPQAPTARVVLLKDGLPLTVGQGSVDYAGRASPGAYRVEAYYAGSPMPWIVSNPIYAGQLPHVTAPVDPAVPPAPVPLASLPTGGVWTVERDPASLGVVDLEGHEWRLTFGLAPGIPGGQYAALVSSLDGDTGFDRVQFTARSDQPMRISVQVRLLGGRDGQRWRRSVYVDRTPRAVVVPLQEFEPVGMTTTQRPIVARVRSVLFVVDTMNTSPGTRGAVWLSNVALGIGSPDRGQ